MNLRPCPFCGSEAALTHSYHADDHRYPRDFWHVKVECSGCEATPTGWWKYGNQEQYVANYHVQQAAEAEVVAIWNKRSIDPVVLQMTETLVYLATMLDYLPHPHCVTAIDMTRESLEAAKVTFKGGA